LTAGFTPASLANCSLWLDAADRSTLTLSGSNVTQWNDKSGNANNTTYANLVVYSLTAINGRPGINFGPGGLNNGSMLSGPLSYSGDQVTAFIIAQFSSNSYDYARFLSIGVPGSTDYTDTRNIQIFGRNTGLTILNIRNFVAATVNVPAYNTPFLAQSQLNSTQVSINVNGSTPVITSGASGNLALSNYYIGASTSSQTGLSGSISEIVFYTTALSTAQRQQIEGYLAWKWGLLNTLPGNHPYRLIKP